MKKKKMFLFVVILLILGGATVFALWKLNRSVCEAEGRALNDEMFQKYEDAFKKLNEAYTQLDMNFASAEIRSAVAPYLLLAAEYRIRQAGSRTERVIVLNQLIETEEALRKIMDRPWEGMGSMEPMRRNAEAASLIVGQARAWFLGVPNPDDPAVGSAADEEETEENETDMEDFDAEEMDADETAPEELDPEKPEESVETDIRYRAHPKKHCLRFS